MLKTTVIFQFDYFRKNVVFIFVFSVLFDADSKSEVSFFGPVCKPSIIRKNLKFANYRFFLDAADENGHWI